jgi:SAM-dependent methyltransferase
VHTAELHAQLLEALSNHEQFVAATLSGAQRGATPPTQRITIRPVDLAQGRHLQFSEFDGRTTTVSNLSMAEAAVRFSALLEAGFATVYLKTLDQDLQLTHSRKGVPRLLRHRPTATAINTSHDRSKPRLLDADAPFLGFVGITDQQGRIKPTARAKYRQVERFVEIVSHTLPTAEVLPAGASIRVVDLGCGAGVLTLAAYHYLSVNRGLEVTMVGVDTKAELVERLNHTARDLGWAGLSFHTGTIDQYQPEDAPEMVIALHACDTATDDALSRAVQWGSSFVLAAPCCQHDLQSQADRSEAPAEYAPLLRHGILRERLGDLLTDALRAEILRGHGYRTEVIEFVSTEHTGKNLMIRATLTGTGQPEASAAARRLADTWAVTPALARKIGYGPDAEYSSSAQGRVEPGQE